jgi:phage FluMu protein Com
MAIFRCKKCGHLREVGNDFIGKSVKCPKCTTVVPIYNTVPFITALIQQNISQQNELKELRQRVTDEDELEIQIIDDDSFDEIDIHNTKILTQSVKYEPIIQWFKRKNIKTEIDQDAIDTTGFFDEIALSMGGNYGVLKFVCNQIKYIQNKGYKNVKLDLARKSQEEIKQIKAFCKELYDYSFVARYHYQKKDQTIRLTLQTVPKIRSFFNGTWMEWFILMKLLIFFQEKKINNSCTRGLNISFPNGATNELDIFFLTEKNIPVCIECKAGEFRRDIDKYLKLRKQLKLDKNQFVLCIFGLSQEQTQGMSSMYDLTFTNEANLINHIGNII